MSTGHKFAVPDVELTDPLGVFADPASPEDAQVVVEDFHLPTGAIQPLDNESDNLEGLGVALEDYRAEMRQQEVQMPPLVHDGRSIDIATSADATNILITSCPLTKFYRGVLATTIMYSRAPVRLTVACPLPFDLWLMLYSATMASQQPVTFQLGQCSDLGALMVIAAVDEVVCSDASLLLLQSLEVNNYAPTSSDVEVLNNLTRLSCDLLVSVVAASQMFSKEELERAINKSAVFAVFGDDLKTRLDRRVKQRGASAPALMTATESSEPAAEPTE